MGTGVPSTDEGLPSATGPAAFTLFPSTVVTEEGTESGTSSETGRGTGRGTGTEAPTEPTTPVGGWCRLRGQWIPCNSHPRFGTEAPESDNAETTAPFVPAGTDAPMMPEVFDAESFVSDTLATAVPVEAAMAMMAPSDADTAEETAATQTQPDADPAKADAAALQAQADLG